jgi:hypothetical protein
MHRILNFGIVLFLIWGHPLGTVNPDDVEFRVRLVKDTRVYHMGESIELEISYSSQIEKKYYGSFSGPTPESIAVTPHVTPSDGVLDLRELRRDRGMAGSFLGSAGYVGPQPNTQQLNLCQWYRFQKPGHYSVIVTSTEVSRLKSTEEGGGREPLTLVSSPVDLDILPADPAWVTGELSNIEQALNTARNAGERVLALQRLALLDTPASVQRLVQLYLVNSIGGEDWILDSGLRDSSQIDVIIPLLEAALSDPAANIPTSLPELLAYLQTRRELGVMPAYPSDPAKQQKWTEEWERRSKVRDKYLARAGALLSASIERRSGPQRATATYQAWYYADQMNATKPLAPEERSRLQSNVLAVANDLDHAQQVQFVVLAWQTMAHEQLLPLIRRLAKDSINHPADYDNHEAIQRWCEGWSEECNAAILQGVLESNAKVDKNVVLLMSEAEHPELDKMLETKLEDPAMLYDFFQSQRTAAVILRAGSHNIVSAVDSFLDQVAGKRGCDGETQGDLLGYLFRAAPEDGGNRLSAKLQNKNDSCGSQVLRTLHSVHPSNDLIPIVTKALDSPNFADAQLAALYLGEHGPASTEDALWRRLEALWSLWQGRSSDLPDEMMGVGTDEKAETAMLERALASALSRAKNWKLSPAELDRLHSGCLTQPCRDIAEGKMSLGL